MDVGKETFKSFIRGIGEDFLERPVCVEDASGGLEIHSRLEWIIGFLAAYHSLETVEFGKILGLSKEKMSFVIHATPLVKEQQIRRIICAWSEDNKPSKATMKRFLRELYFGDKLDLLRKICSLQLPATIKFEQISSESVVGLNEPELCSVELKSKFEPISIPFLPSGDKDITEHSILEDLHYVKPNAVQLQATTKFGPISFDSVAGLESVTSDVPESELCSDVLKSELTSTPSGDKEYNDITEYSEPEGRLYVKPNAVQLQATTKLGPISFDGVAELESVTSDVPESELCSDVLKSGLTSTPSGDKEYNDIDMRPFTIMCESELFETEYSEPGDLHYVKPNESCLPIEETTESVSSLHHQEQTSRSSSNETLRFVPFIGSRQILEFNSTGAVFTGFDEIKIDIPPNAIPYGIRGRLEVGVCLYGPFMFEENYQPISPILWLCLQGNIRHLAKPIRLTLPHILPDLSEEDLVSFGIRFVKANHDHVTNANGERVYKFQPSLDETSYYSSGGKGYGVLQTDHFCYMCLEAESTTDHEMAKHMGYCLTCVQGPSTLCIFATYFLNTCLAALEQQIKKLEDGCVVVSKERFKLSQNCDHLEILCNPREAVNMIPLSGKIFETKINFWKKSFAVMMLEHEHGIYPPRLKISNRSRGSAQNLTISFSNVQEGSDLDMELIHPPSVAVEQLPPTDTSFTKQADDWSDYKQDSETEVKDSVQSHWNLKEVHGKGIDGDGITVAVLDTSVNINHEVFDTKKFDGKSFLNETPDHYWYSSCERRHGTMVAGIVAKYAPKAKIFVCCVAENHKSFKRSAIIEALKYLRDENKCQVIVMSFGRPDDKRVDKREELINELVGKGVVCVAAVGNDGLFGDCIAFPACLPNVIAVGGLDSTGFHLSKLNNPGQKIDVYAPGEKVSVPSATNDHGYQEGKGSSCAAPAIGGIVALLMQQARECGVQVNDIELLKKMFSRMKKKVVQNGETHDVFKPKDFFHKYDTHNKLKTLVEQL